MDMDASSPARGLEGAEPLYRCTQCRMTLALYFTHEEMNRFKRVNASAPINKHPKYDQFKVLTTWLLTDNNAFDDARCKHKVNVNENRKSKQDVNSIPFIKHDLLKTFLKGFGKK